MLHDGVDNILQTMIVVGERLAAGRFIRGSSVVANIDEAFRSLHHSSFDHIVFPERTDLRRVFNTIGQSLSLITDWAYGAKLDIHAPPEEEENIPLTAEEAQALFQSLLELTRNATKYGATTISITWDPVTREVVVSDNGMGIHDTRGIWGGKREHPGVLGSGQGLGFVKKRLTPLGWTIYVESTPGKGSNFYIQIR